MSEIEHIRTLGKVHHYSNTKILDLLIEPLKMTIADAGDVSIFCGYNSMTYYCGEV